LFSATTTARPREALALRWDDVNLPADIRRKMYRHTRKQQALCGLNTALVVSAPKTKAGIRTIPLVGPMVEELRRLQRVQAEHRDLFGDGCEENRLVFATPHGCFLGVGEVIRRDFNLIVKRLKLPKIRYYDLRHSTASFRISLGVDVQTVSAIMGHGSASFTLSRYVHNVAGTKEAAMRRLEGSVPQCPR
jgi:integrase